MGNNLYTACHKCKVKISYLRRKESEDILGFYKAHSLCAKDNINNVQTVMDNNGTDQDWMNSYNSGGYKFVSKDDDYVNNDRYFVDVRTGCAAIRDREHPLYDKDNQGLNDEMPDVVKFFMGNANPVVGNCSGHWEWKVSSSRIKQLEQECKRLNDENNKV